MLKNKDEHSIILQQNVNDLLQLIAEGRQVESEEIIKQNRKILSLAGDVKDRSGREFKNIKPLQYPLWAMDWHMCKMIISYLPPSLAWEQILDLKRNGTPYGTHFSLQPLITELGNYVKYPTERQWCHRIGGEQILLPVHVINQYCRTDISFSPLPDFEENSLPRITHILNDIDWFETISVSYTMLWGYLGGKCGESMAFVKGNSKNCLFARGHGQGCDLAIVFAKHDWLAMKKLAEVQARQIQLLEHALQHKLELMYFFKPMMPNEITSIICNYFS